MSIDFNFYLEDTSIAVSITNQEIQVGDNCSRIILTPLYDATHVAADGFASVAINQTTNLPRAIIAQQLIMENVDGQIKRIFVTNNLETAIVGCNNNGYLEVRESIEQVLAKIKNLKS